MKDADVRFHEQWLGLAQPVEGLVFSVPALVDAQIAPKVRAGITAELEAHLEETEHGIALHSVREFFETFLGYARPGMLVAREDLPSELKFYAQEGRQEIRPSFAIARGPFESPNDDPFAKFEAAPVDATPAARTAPSNEGSPYMAVVWDLTTDAGPGGVGLDLDKAEAETGPWRYPPTAKLERLLRHTGIPIGFISNRRALRVVYAPSGESSAHLTFRFEDLAQGAGRPLVAALELIVHSQRTYGAAREFTFEGLLRESRLRQADVTKDLAAQVFEAVEILLEGYEHAAARDCVGDRVDWLRAAIEASDDHFYQGILSVVLRLVFILYAEDQALVPVQHPTYAEHLSVLGLYGRLADDAGAHPESMHLRFGAYGRLVSLFRAMFLGVTHGELRLPPRRGKLFDPSAFPFLEGGLPNWTAAITLPEERAAVQLPSIDDDTVYRVLHRLVVFKGQRLSYRSLDVEQIGAVYESLMGYHVLRVTSPAVRLGSERAWVETEALRAMKPTERKRFWKETCGLSNSGQDKAEAAVKVAKDNVTLAEELGELAPGGKTEKSRHRAGSGRLVLQPGEERRRTGSHYTPRWLSEKVVKRTLEPILACLGENRTAEQILSLKICDPAMGSGAFLVAACRLLADEVVTAWDRAGEAAALTEQHGDALLHARRLVAQRCLYGVDKNAAAVELAKLSLWLVTLSKELPFTFVDHALRHGDSLVGLDLEQIRSFHWEPKEQLETCRRALDDALEQALEHRDAILALADKEDAGSQREKQRLLEYSERATARIRMIADVCVGAFFAKDKPKEREKERDRRLDLVRRLLDGDESVREQLETMTTEMCTRHVPFHWMVEFPEVFYLERRDPLSQDGQSARAAYMECFVGNPPFLRGRDVSSQLGDEYRQWLLGLHEPSHGNGDLVAHFFRRASSLLGAHGTLGFVATNTISQGDTRTTGLQPLARQGKTYAATRTLPWPGNAAVTVSLVHVALGRPAQFIHTPVLDDLPVDAINSRLRPKPERPDPVALEHNGDISSKGMDIGGVGFAVSPEERAALVARDRNNAPRLREYISGERFNDSPTHEHDRYVAYLDDLSLDEARQFPDLLALADQRVRPERERLRDNDINRRMKRFWWRYWAARPRLQEQLRALSRCLACAVISKHLSFAFQPADRIFTNGLYIFPSDTCSFFAVLQSRVHEVWARLLSSSLEDRLRYAASDCFETFPFPQADPRTVIDPLESIGETLYETRAKYMVDTDQGLTKTYNALKDPTNDDPRIVELRRLHEEMDRAVLDAYGWTDPPPVSWTGRIRQNGPTQNVQRLDEEAPPVQGGVQGRGGSNLPRIEQEPAHRGQGAGADAELGVCLGAPGRGGREGRRPGGAHDGGACRACRPSAREPGPPPGARHPEKGHGFFRQGGHVVSADVHLVAAETDTSVAAVCRVLEVPRSTVYARRGQPLSERAKETAKLDVAITAVFAENRGRYGSPRVHRVLRNRGTRLGRKRVEARMRVLRLKARRPKRFRRTTEANPTHVPAPNVLDRRFDDWALPNQAWVGDITYIWTHGGWVYLAILLDLCTRGIVGWAVSTHCDAKLALEALDRAVARHRPPRGLLHHTDRGSTYTAEDYRRRLRALGMTESMSRKGNCWDNAVAESTFGTIKAELFADAAIPADLHEVSRALFPYIEGFYNRTRLHSSLGYKTPAERELEALKTESAA